MKKSLFLFACLIVCQLLSAQLQEVNIEQKFRNSTLIVEAKVLEKKAFKCEGKIYERNKLQVFQSLKGSVHEYEIIYIITRGGSLKDERQIWHHAAKLTIGQNILAFLKPSIIDCSGQEDFDFYSGSQGKYYFQGDASALSIVCPLDSYSNPKDFYEVISNFSSEPFLPMQFSNSETCLSFVFDVSHPDVSNPLLLDVLVSIRSTGESRLISEPVIKFKYDTTAIGANAQSNGLVSLENIGISEHVNYESVIEDAAPDSILIRIDAIDLSEPDMIWITNTPQPLVKVRVQMPSVLDPDILLDEAVMQTYSRYFDLQDNVEKYFNCIRVEGDLESIFGCSPVISNIFLAPLPDQPSAAGVDLLLDITGDCFTDNPSGNGRIEFTNALTGVDNGVVEWVKAYDYDIVFWSNTNIVVLVPSTCDVSSAWEYPEGYAGTGKIRVNTGNTGMSQFDVVESSQEIEIDFAWQNMIGDSPDLLSSNFPFNHSLPVYLTHFTETDASYWMHFDPEFPSEYRPAFQRALDSWRCSDVGSGINIELVEPSELDEASLNFISSRIYTDQLPEGTTSDGVEYIRLAQTNTTVSFCEDSDVQTLARRTKSDIIFNSDVDWHYEVETSGVTLDELNEADLETTALHELGHWHGLQHVNEEEDIMYYRPSTDFHRVITEDATNGGTYILEQSTDPFISSIITACSGWGAHVLYSDCFNQTSIQEQYEHGQIYVYPNPTTDKVFIHMEDNSLLGGKVLILDAISNLVKTVSIQETTDISIDFTSFESGIYFLVSQNGEWKSKVIKL